MQQSPKQRAQRQWRCGYGLLLANRVTILNKAESYLSKWEYVVLRRLIDRIIEGHNQSYRNFGLNIPTEAERKAKRLQELEEDE